MNRYNLRMLRRSIQGSMGRFLAILAIVALGVGFFAGLKSSQPSMLHTAQDYFERNRLYDFQLISSLGLTEGDAEAFRVLPDVKAAEGACFADAWVTPEGGVEDVYHFQTLTKEVSMPALLSGRMPERAGECLVDSKAFSEADIGKTLTLSPRNDEETFEHFGERKFVITGLARSPRYISGDRGSSELGSGKPAGFVLIPAEAFADEVYHELLIWCDLPGELYSETYLDARRHLRPAIEALLNKRGVLREEELLRDGRKELQEARDELDDGWLEYRIGKRKSDEELALALEKLQRSQKQWEEGILELQHSENTLNRTEKEAQDGLDALPQKRADLEARQSELSSEKQSLILQRAALEAEKLAAEAGRAVLVSPQAAQLTAAYARLLVLQLDPVGNADAIAALQEEIYGENGLQAQLDAAQAEQDALFDQQAAERDGKIEALKVQIAAIELEEDEVSAALTALQAEEMQYNVTLASIPEARDDIEYNKLVMRDAAYELQMGWQEYYDGKNKAEKELGEALKKLEDGEREYAEGEAELNDALQLDLYTLDRSANPGYVTFENDSAIVDGVAGPFPIFFSLVAALVCVTTMTRMVTEERTQIGTMKALGYSSGVIMAKYLLYAGISSLIGCILGYYIGSTGLPYLVWYAYNIMYQYEDLIFTFSSLIFVGSLVVSVAGSVFVTWLACRTALAEKPAELIRPRAPATGKRILLERLPHLWNSLPFLGKLSFRNAFRYPVRVLMMILGISGCTALLVAGFGVKDSISNVGSYQYGEISFYDMTVTLEAGTDPAIFEGSEALATVHHEDIRLLNGEKGKNTELIAGDGEDIEGVLSLHRKNGTELAFPGKDEVIITRKLSEQLGLKEGDSAVIRMDSGKEVPVTVTGVCEYFVGHSVFAARETFGTIRDNYAYVRLPEGEDAGRYAAQLRSREGVQYVGLVQTERETIETSMQSLDLLVIMLVCCSAALAFITLYNLTNINLMERLREVATVKVLGFTPGETSSYILNENLLLSFLGGAAGLLLGKVLHRFVLGMIDLDYMTYDIRITALSYALSFAVTMVFAMLTNLVMRGKLSKVNMAESLKSVE